ncbi:MAG TPA: hypothetical protein VHI95_17255 [Acidimicrobiales bacterium]|jgi:hypothetical protein|nr:hypothetical protein [Acidimicrobiales bacterium]
MEWPTTCTVCGLGLGENFLVHIDAGSPHSAEQPSIAAAYCSRECLESAELYFPK